MPLPIDKTYLLAQLRNFKTIILDPDFKIQKTELPTASEDNEGAVFQYVGTDTTNYTIGGFYQCQEVTPVTDPPTYTWVEVSTKTLIDDTTIKRDTNTKELYVPKGSSSALGVFKAGGGLTADSNGVLSANTNIFNGTIADYEALSADEKKKYSHIADDSDPYTTEAYTYAESDTGKIWVNDKHIYRRVFVGLDYGNTSDWVDISGISSDFVNTIHDLVTVICKRPSDNMICNNILIRKSGSVLQSYSNLSNIHAKTLIIDYTKL